MPKHEDKLNRTDADLVRIAQDHLSLIYDNVSDVVFALSVTDDGRFRFRSINKRFLQATGFAEIDILGKYVEEVIPPTAHSLVLSKYREAVWTKKVVSWEEVSVYPSGEKVGQVTVAPVIGKDAFHTLFEFIEEIDVSPTCIVMELSEGTILNLDERMLEKFDLLKDRGVQLALDDFGTGYSSLSYITKLKFDFLKIYQVFVRNLESSQTNLALCETMIVMAHKLDMKVIAEGIETEPQRRTLTEAGCNYGQGFLFAKPMPFGEFERFLRGTPSLLDGTDP